MKKENETLSEKELDNQELHSGALGLFNKTDVKEFIKQGDKIFYAKDYGNDNVSNEEYNYAVKKWEEFKKLAGEKLTK